MGGKAAIKRERIGLPPRAGIEQGALFAENRGVCEGAAEKSGGGRGPGRPAGSVNRDTEDMRRYLASLGYRPGQIALAEVGGGGTLDELLMRARHMARVLDCEPIEAMKLVMKAASELATYTGSKVQAPPAAVALPAGVVLLQVSADQAAQMVDAGMVYLGPQKSPENGEIIDVSPSQSDTSHSDT